MGDYGRVRQLTGGSGKLDKGSEELGADDEDPGTVWGIPEGIRDILQGGISGSVAFWFGKVGPEPPHGTVPRQFSTQVRAVDHQEAAEEAGV